MPPVFAMILAAGQSRRFGGDKLSAGFRGRSVLVHAIEAVQAAEREGIVRASWVVVANGASDVARVAEEHGACVVVAPDAHRGMGWSIRAGMAAVSRSAPAGAAAVLVVLGDQPFLRPSVLAALVRRWRASGAAAVRPRYATEPDAPGHPVLVDRSRWGDLASLEGDRGLGALPEAEIVDVPGSNPDIDTPDDLATLAGEEPD